MPGNATDAFDHLKGSLDRHLDRLKGMVLDGKAGRYTTARFVADVVGCSLDVIEFWRGYPLPWEGEMPTVTIDVPSGADEIWGAAIVHGVPEGAVDVIEPKKGAWPDNFGALVRARIVGDSPGSLVVCVSGIRGFAPKSGEKRQAILKIEKQHIANLEVSFA